MERGSDTIARDSASFSLPTIIGTQERQKHEHALALLHEAFGADGNAGKELNHETWKPCVECRLSFLTQDGVFIKLQVINCEKLEREKEQHEETAEKAQDHGGAMENQML